MSDNSKIWDLVSKTDPDYTKSADVGGYKHTAINANYQYMRATEIFGPCGKGWGFKVIEERYDDGAPMVTVVDGAPPIIQFEKVHTLRINFWYKDEEGTHTIEDVYGHTKCLYKSSGGKIIHDGEAPKKSETDAIKKAMSFLGFSADIYMGMFEDRDYVDQVRIESAIEKAEDREAEVAAKREELTSEIKAALNTLNGAQSQHELKSLFTKHARSLERLKQVNDLADLADGGLKALARDVEKRKAELADKEGGK